MNHYVVDFDISQASVDLAERIATFSWEHRTADEIQTLVDEAESIVSQSKPGRPLERWTCWLSAARCLVATKILSNAVQSGTGVADAKARLEILQNEFATATDFYVTDGASEENQLSSDEQIAMCIDRPLPVLYWRRDQQWERYRNAQPVVSSPDDSTNDEPLPTVARLIVHIDDSPLVSPQEVRPGTLYRVQLEAHLASWPQRVMGLTFIFTTTLASTQYSLSGFDTTNFDVTGEETHIVRATGTLAFPYAQNDPFNPIVFAVSASLLIGEEKCPIRIVGHDQLQFRVRDESRTLLSSGWPRMDAHVHDLVQALCDKQPAVRDEFDVLLPLLDALTAVLGTFAQGGLLKGRTDVGEDEFQEEVLKLLRVKLGEDVQEGPKQAGGITDIRYQGCVVELKVEDSISDRDKVFAKYTSQPTQYQGVEARSVAILLVLDLTDKSEPPGDLRNDILLKEVETHGGSGDYPSWAFMFVVRGNVKSPSSYSR